LGGGGARDPVSYAYAWRNFASGPKLG